MTNNYKICACTSLTLGILFFVSVFNLPYGFYTFMRVFTLVLSALYVFYYYSETEKFSLTFIPVLAIGILWNPIAPIYMDKNTWVVFDYIAAIIEFFIFAYIISKNFSKK